METKMGRLFQIHEEDLAELERIVPDVSDAMMQHLGARQKTQLRRVKEIISNIRWNYGPHEFVEAIGGDGQG